MSGKFVDALLLLGFENDETPDTDDLIDAYQEKLLPVKQYWLTNPIVELLFLKRLETAKSLYIALTSIVEEHPFSSVNSTAKTELSPTSLVADFEKSLSEIKRNISSSWSFEGLESLVLLQIGLQHQLEAKVLEMVLNHFGKLEEWPENRDKEVKLAQIISTVELNKILAKRFSELNKLEEYALLTEAGRILKGLSLKSRQ